MIEAAVVGLIVGLGKVWDKLSARRTKRQAKIQLADYMKELDTHAAADNASFAAINTGIAVIQNSVVALDRKIDSVSDRVDHIIFTELASKKL